LATTRARLTARHAARLLLARARRRAHLLLLASGERARIRGAFAQLAARAARLPALRVGGRLYHVPPAMARALLRVVPGAGAPASPAPRVVPSPAGVQRYVALLAARVGRAPRSARLVLRRGRRLRRQRSLPPSGGSESLGAGGSGFGDMLVLLPSITGQALDMRAAERALDAALSAPATAGPHRHNTASGSPEVRAIHPVDGSLSPLWAGRRPTGSEEGGAVVVLPLRFARPAVETSMLASALARGRWLLAHPPTLAYGTIRWTPAPGALAPTLRLDANGQTLQMDAHALRHVVAWLAHAVARAPQNAAFAVDGQTAHVVPAVDGWALDAQALALRLLRAAPGTTEIAVPLRRVAPQLTTARARAMHIRTMVGMSYTNFYGSTVNRITNILAAVHALDGALIAPGAVFSFNTAIGDIDYAHGYVDGIDIIDGKDVPGVGGGVCQVAVTIFKGALYTGLPIVERVPHANVVSYYQPIGMDATVYQAPGGPDVKFKNTTGHWLLMKFAYDLSTAYLEVRFYGTNVDQQTEIDGPYYTYPGNGDTLTIFYRKVFRHGKKIIDESFFSHYVPVQ
jgi:vancomycin resistance protein YoaR